MESIETGELPWGHAACHTLEMPNPRVQFRCPQSEIDRWEQSASNERRDLVDWIRNVLDIVSESGVTIQDLPATLERGKSRKGQK